jgi:hypothetical protein
LGARDNFRLCSRSCQPPQVRPGLKVRLDRASVVPSLLYHPDAAARPCLPWRTRPSTTRARTGAGARSAPLHLLILRALSIEPLAEMVHLVRHLIKATSNMYADTHQALVVWYRSVRHTGRFNPTFSRALTFFSRASAIAVGSLVIEKRLQSRLDGRPLLPARLRFRSDISPRLSESRVYTRQRRR